MAQGGVLGFGTKVAFSSTSPTTWTQVPQLLELGFPGFEPDEVETTVHGSLPYRRNIRGLIDVGEMTLRVQADLASNSVHRQLRQLQLAGTTVWWRIEAPENREKTSWVGFEFQGWVKNWVLETPIDDQQTIEITVRFDGTDFAMYAPGASQIS